MQSAIFETHAIYVSADVHDGWDRIRKNCKTIEAATIAPPNKPDDVGGHAFAMVGYTVDGFIIQNSWGPSWGYQGFAILPYEDWTRYGTDAWALALGAPMRVSLPALKKKAGTRAQDLSKFRSPAMRTELSLDERLRSRSMLRNRVANDTSEVPPWINGEEARRLIFIGHNGSAERELVEADSGDDAVGMVVRDCVETAAKRGYSHLVIYAHGGLNSRADGLDRARVLGPWFEANGIMPIFVVWQTGFLESATDILKGAVEKLGIPVSADKGWLRSKINEVKDRAFEVFARDAGVKAIWENMKFRADGASSRGGGLMTAAKELQASIGGLPRNQRPEIHSDGALGRSHHAGALPVGHEGAGSQGKFDSAVGAGLHGRICNGQIRTGLREQGRRSQDDLHRSVERQQRTDRSVRAGTLFEIIAVSGFAGAGARPQNAGSGAAEGLAEMVRGRELHGRLSEGIIDRWNAASKDVVLDPPVTETEVPIRAETNKDETIDASHGSFDNNLTIVNRAIKRVIGKNPRVPVTDLRGY